MWKLRRSKKNDLNRELTYASHHHLIPLYALCGTTMLGVLVLACFIVPLWQDMQQNSRRPQVETTITNVENKYLPTAISPAEKKQYIYAANVRFKLTNPYNTLRYSYDPGIGNTPTSATIVITTSSIMNTYEQQLRANPKSLATYAPQFQQCSQLYTIRFQPGAVPTGGFQPLQEVKLKDGRTAYIHQNATCVPSSTAAMDTLDDVESAVLSIESY